MKSKEYLKDLAVNGTPAEKKEIFSFNSSHTPQQVLFKFKLYSRSCFSRYFKSQSAPYHDDFVLDYIDSYRGDFNVLEAAHRDGAKTSILKLFVPFVIQNDTQQLRKYIKVLSKEGANSKQFVTDVYNMMVETAYIYGDQFEKEGDKKREETMGSFTTKNQVKLVSGTIGTDQRGHLQDAFRPDWQIFEDIEDSTSITSQVRTQGSIIRAQEAIDGRAKGSKYVVNCNYISEDGVVQWFMNKPGVRTRITPIAKDIQYGLDPEGKKTLVAATALWPRFTLADLIERYQDSEDWFGEFMCDPSRSDNKFFDIDLINHHIETFAKEPKKVSGKVRYWGDYQPHHRYGQGSDHSEGIGADANTLIGWDFTTGELAYGHADNAISPDLATHEYNRIGREYGHPIWAPEVNNKCGGIVITTARSLDYPNLYRYEIKDKFGTTLSNKIGWETNGKTKNTMYMDFRRDFNDGLIKIYDIDFLKEMKAYTNEDLTERTTGLLTRHFDYLTAGVIGWQMKDKASSSQDSDGDEWGGKALSDY